MKCDNTQGLLLIEQEGMLKNTCFDSDISNIIAPIYIDTTIEMGFGDGHRYLPDEFQMSGISSWNSSYSINGTAQSCGNPIFNTVSADNPLQTTVFSRDVVVNFTEYANQAFTLFDGTEVNAYKVNYNTAAEDPTTGETENT